jgi:hypothetical protein
MSRLTGHFFQQVQITTRKNTTGKKVQSSGRWRRLRFGGNITTGKKHTVVWPAMLFSGVKLQPEKTTTEKKNYSRLANLFFRS